MQHKQNPAPQLSWIDALAGRSEREILDQLTQRFHPSESPFAWQVEELAEGWTLAQKGAEIERLKKQYPLHLARIQRGVFRGHLRLGQKTIARLVLEEMAYDSDRVYLAVEEGALDLAISEFDAQQASLEGWTRYNLSRRLGLALLDALRPKDADRFLRVSKDQLLAPSPGFTRYDSHVRDAAVDFGRLGDLETMKSLLGSVKEKTQTDFSTALHESFMSSFRAGLIRK